VKALSVFIKVLAVVLILIWSYHVFAQPKVLIDRAKGEPEVYLCQSGRVMLYCIAFKEGQRYIVFIWNGKEVEAVFTTDETWEKQEYIWFRQSI